MVLLEINLLSRSCYMLLGCFDKLEAWNYSRKWHAEHLNQSLDRASLASLEDQADTSLARQRELEASHQQPFGDYLAKFYSQY